MLKIIGSIILALAGTLGGYSASLNLSLRVKFYEEYLRFISYLSTEIRYSTSNLPELFEKYKKNPMFSELLETCLCKISEDNTLSCSWKEATGTMIGKYGLKAGDIDVIKAFSENLGLSDIDGQMAHCKLNMKLVNTYLEKAKEEQKRKSKLYITLGLFSGICIAMLIV